MYNNILNKKMKVLKMIFLYKKVNKNKIKVDN